MKETVKTTGVLLKRTWLANDDAVLDIFTADLGRVTVFAGKLANSKKRQQELDFFRLMDLELISGRSGYRLGSVSTKRWWGTLQADYKMSSQLFVVLENLRRILPEEKELPAFFELSLGILDVIDKDNYVPYLAFWEVKALVFSGVCPDFEASRTDVWWQFESFELFTAKIPHGVAIPNLVRQVLAFLRRTDFEEFQTKATSLPEAETAQTLSILQEISQYH